ncbi:MAG TPA: PsbP-related protein [Ktedonobacteraceae bacterium]
MITFWKRVNRWISVSLSTLFLLLFLAACGGVGNSNPTPTPLPPTPTPSPTAIPTQAPQFQTYKGDGFTIDYPQGWKIQSGQQGAIVFTDAQQFNTVTVVAVPNPGGAVSASQQLTLGLAGAEKLENVSNVQPVSLPSTTKVGGETWVQSGVTGNVKVQGASVPGKLVGLADNHPANSPTTKTYEIYYGGPTLSFEQEDAQAFQPMLESFKFTA